MSVLSNPAPTARLSVRLTPRASANAVVRYQDGVLHLRLTAPPVEGQANAACCRFVAQLLGTAPSRVKVEKGHKSRDKVLLIEGIGQEGLETAVAGNVVQDEATRRTFRSERGTG